MRNIFIGIVMTFAIGMSTAYAENPDYLPGEVPILFVQKCKTCHGKDGRATKIAIPAAITTNPRNFAVKPNKGKVTALNIA